MTEAALALRRRTPGSRPTRSLAPLGMNAVAFLDALDGCATRVRALLELLAREAAAHASHSAGHAPSWRRARRSCRDALRRIPLARRAMSGDRARGRRAGASLPDRCSGGAVSSPPDPNPRRAPAVTTDRSALTPCSFTSEGATEVVAKTAPAWRRWARSDPWRERCAASSIATSKICAYAGLRDCAA